MQICVSCWGSKQNTFSGRKDCSTMQFSTGGHAKMLKILRTQKRSKMQETDQQWTDAVARFSGSGLLSSGLIRILILKFQSPCRMFRCSIFFFFLDFFRPSTAAGTPTSYSAATGGPGRGSAEARRQQF